MNFPLGIYALLFVGLLVGGETILVPIVYFSLFGSHNINIWIVMVLAIIATVISDTVWYAIGRSIRLQSFLIERLGLEKVIKKPLNLATKFLNSYDLKLLFISKFIYGTRIVMQIVSGIQKVPFWTYQSINTLAVITWFFLILILAYVTGESFLKLFSNSNSLYIGFGAFILITALVIFFFKKYLGSKI